MDKFHNRIARYTRLASCVVLVVTLLALVVFIGQSHADTVALGQNEQSAPPANDGGAGTCTSMYVNNLALAAGQPANNRIYGELCNPRHGASQTVELLVAGLTYDYQYWDWPSTPQDPQGSQDYSAVRYFTGYYSPAGIGYSTFSIDRIGIGLSSHPVSTDVNMATNTYILHQIVSRLKAGSIGHTKFPRVLLIGHSFGSRVSLTEAATYHDVNGVVLTGALHDQNPNATTIAPAIEASSDPAFASMNLDSGYLTDGPGSIQAAFYYDPGTYSDPNVIAYNNQIKQTMTVSELTDLKTALTSTLSRQINVPVLLVVGQEDMLSCVDAVNCSSAATVYQEEAPFYSPQAKLQVRVIPNTGHVLNLHYSAHTTYAEIMTWALAHVAP
jgi:pimeloyl-ACP methyl ester carboxylesterase